MADSLTLCQLLNSNLCHEISGPISAINNSIDLIESENPEIKKNAIELVIDANRQLFNKIKFYSHIYSFSDSNSEQVSIHDIKELCLGFFYESKITVDFNFSFGPKILSHDISKILMCLLITARKNLTKDGLIQVISQDYDNILIKATAENLHLNPHMIEILNDGNQKSPNIFNCNENYIKLLNRKVGYKLAINASANSIEYNIYKDIKPYSEDASPCE